MVSMWNKIQVQRNVFINGFLKWRAGLWKIIYANVTLNLASWNAVLIYSIWLAALAMSFKMIHLFVKIKYKDFICLKVIEGILERIYFPDSMQLWLRSKTCLVSKIMTPG